MEPGNWASWGGKKWEECYPSLGGQVTCSGVKLQSQGESAGQDLGHTLPGPGYQRKGAQCLGFLWGQRPHGLGVLPQQESRVAPASLEGEPTAQERGPLGGRPLMLASQYAVFASPHFGDP